MNKEIAESLVQWDDHPEEDDYELIEDATIYNKTRWHLYYYMVYRHIEDNTFWRITYRQGATELQDDGPEDISVVQVYPREKTIIEYVESI